MERFEHGGDVYAHPGALDFSASLNPAGMPQVAERALRDSLPAFGAYPDPHCRELTRATAAFEGVPEEWVLPCAGATDALTRLCAVVRPEQALVCAPCYRGYEQALEQVGAQVAYVDLSAEDDFVLRPTMASGLVGGVSLVFLANPNNPTGRLIDRETLVAWLDRACEVGAIVALDECFVDLTDAQGSNDLLDRYHNLVLIKALTKSFCLAGVRVGAALCADGALLDRMRKVGLPWAVSVPAQVAGVASLGAAGYLHESRRLVARERARLSKGLASLGLHVVPSEANYLLFEGPSWLGDALLDRNILLRTCDNFRGLGAGWYRIAVRTPEQNGILLAILGEVLACRESR